MESLYGTFFLTLLTIGMKDIRVLQASAAPSSGLYFMLNDSIFNPGTYISIDRIGSQPSERVNAGSTLACITTNVNTACCRSNDTNNGAPQGSWLYPNGTLIPSPSQLGVATDTFTRYVYTQQLRLSKVGDPNGPLGTYTCIIPDSNGMNNTAKITIIPSSGLHFLLGNIIYNPGASLGINRIGSQPNDRGNAGNTLACITTNVNTECCRGRDSASGNPQGSWLYPNGTLIPSPSQPSATNTFTRYVYTQQIRLSSVGNPKGPFGNYTCVIPDINGANITATIYIVASDIIGIVRPDGNSSLNLNEGVTAVLNCIARDMSQPSIVWSPGPDLRRNITVIESIESDGFEVVTSNLTIYNVHRDEPLYSCDVGKESRFFTLVVNFVPQVTPTLREIQFLSPSLLLLNCSAEGFPLPTISWVKTLSNGSMAIFTKSMALGNDRNLVINNYDAGNTVISVFSISPSVPSDTGNYLCRASNSLGSDNFSSAVIVLASPNITFPMNSQQFSADEYSNINFSCIATGSPAPVISFHYNGQVLNNTQEVFISKASSVYDRAVLKNQTVILNEESGLYEVTEVLTVQRITRNDFITITCIASSNLCGDFSQQESLFHLYVNLSPRITLLYGQTNYVSIDAGNNLTLSAVIEEYNSPLTSIMWSHNYVPVYNGDDRIITGLNSSMSAKPPVMATLQRMSSIPLDAGRYTITAANDVGSITITFNVTIYKSPVIVSRLEETLVEVNEGDLLSVNCTVSAVPKAVVFWSTSGDVDTLESIDQQGFQLTVSILTLATTQRNLTAITCTASNNHGFEQKLFEVLTYFPPMFISMPFSSMLVQIASPLILSCTTEGLPLPTIVWLQDLSNGSQIKHLTTLSPITIKEDSYNSTIISVFTINNTDVPNSGNYSCQAKNQLGTSLSSRASVQLFIPAPVNLTATEVMMTSVILTWYYSIDLINHFLVMASFNSTYSVRAIYNSSNARFFSNGTWRATLTGLSAGSWYNIYVISLAGELLEAASSRAGPVTVLTKSRELFQLVLQIGISCNIWRSNNPMDKSSIIAAHIQSVLSSDCQCSLGMETIVNNGGFRCFPDSPEFVTYRAEIDGTSQKSALDFLHIMELWLESGPSLNIEAQFFALKTSCPILISSIDEIECDIAKVTTIFPVTEVSTSENSLIIIIIIMVIFCVTVVTIIAIFGVILLFPKLRRRWSQRKAQKMLSSDVVKLRYMRRHQSEQSLSQSTQEPHDYELIESLAMRIRNNVISNPGATNEEFSVTPCDAYNINELSENNEEILNGEDDTSDDYNREHSEDSESVENSERSDHSNCDQSVGEDTDHVYSVIQKGSNRIRDTEQHHEFLTSLDHYIT